MKGTNEQKRFHCPFCGMMADFERLDTDQPYELEAFLEKYGGKVSESIAQRLEKKHKESFRGVAAGLITYERISVPANLKRQAANQARRVWEKVK